MTFMFPQANFSTARPFLQCPPGEAAVGYSAQSGCYSLTNVTVSALTRSLLYKGAKYRPFSPNLMLETASCDQQLHWMSVGISTSQIDVLPRCNKRAFGNLSRDRLPKYIWYSDLKEEKVATFVKAQ